MQYYQFYTPGPQPFKRCILQLKKLPNGSPNHASQDEVTTTMSPPKKKHTHRQFVAPKRMATLDLTVWLACIGFCSQPPSTQKLKHCVPVAKNTGAIADPKKAPKMFTKRNGVGGSCFHPF